MTAEQIDQKRERDRRWWANMSTEQRERALQRKRVANMSPEQIEWKQEQDRKRRAFVLAARGEVSS